MASGNVDVKVRYRRRWLKYIALLIMHAYLLFSNNEARAANLYIRLVGMQWHFGFGDWEHPHVSPDVKIER